MKKAQSRNWGSSWEYSKYRMHPMITDIREINHRIETIVIQQDRHRKVDMPAFNGTDPDGWILQAERYFVIYQLIDEEKLEAAILSLSGDALAWYRWADRQQTIITWDHMKSLFLKRFRSIQGGDLYEQWSSLEQTGTAAEYVRRFIELSAPLEGVTDRVAIGSIIKGLKPNIRNDGNSGIAPGNTYRRGQGTDRPLTEAQIQDKRARGLCYKCDEKWQRNHRCKSQINVILVEEVAEDEEGEEIPPGDEPDATLEAAEMDEQVEISLNSVAGLTSPKTMKLRGRVMEQAVVTMIDPGATHNFISSKLVEELQIPVLESRNRRVQHSNGNRGQGAGKRNLQRGTAAIARARHHRGIPSTKTNWKEQTMAFMLGAKQITLKGDPSLGKSLVSLRAMEREVCREGAGVLIELNEVETEKEKNQEPPEFLKAALEPFKDLFATPTGMPPKRNMEHQITLKEGTAPISVRLYRYPHFQKEEIERLIKEVLTAGVIQASNNPYSSPVILVKKKDGSWRFCVDYRALNRATVLDKFPIPVIDELLDELHGAVIFSKLDLRSGYHQIQVKTEDVPKTAFRTHDGHYEFKLQSRETRESLDNRFKIVAGTAMPNFSKTFVVETDASGYGLGAVLSQDSRPVAYYSCVLGTRACLKSIYEKELMAIVKAVLKWRPYLGSNKVADALSRKETELECSNVEMRFWKFWDQLKEELQKDEFINKIKTELGRDPGSHQGFSVFQGNLLFKKRLVIPAKSALISEIISEFHNSPIEGHSGEKKTYQRAVAEVYWVGMRRDIVDHVRKCIVCTQHKSLTSAPAEPIPLPTRLWEEITMDFIEGLPRSEGWDVILVVVDRLSKYGHFIPLPHPFTASTVANSFMEVVRLHGMPNSIISDRDRIFTSHFWMEMFRLHGVQLKKSTAYHPQTDGQTEVVNRCLETYLRCFCSEKPKSWYRWLTWAEFWYNTSYHSALPFGPYTDRIPHPLSARYYGPYRINQQIGKVAYKLELPNTATIHPVFHVSQLKTAHGVPNSPTELPPQLNRELEMMVQPEQVMGMRSKKDGNEDVLEVLVAWQGLTESEATWEDLEKMKQAFPNHNLENKLKVWAASVDKPPITRVYSRRVMDRSWMYSAPRCSEPFIKGVQKFLNFAFERSNVNRKVLCPCELYLNMLYFGRKDILDHLICSKFRLEYLEWVYRGEASLTTSSGTIHNEEEELFHHDMNGRRSVN
ncbi:hypothetical protein LXL04_024459 [Taraxacum kok-saghyz]